MNHDKNWFSKKFIAMIIAMVAAVFLLIFAKITEWPFIILFGGAFLMYTCVEGYIDLRAIKRIEAGPVKIEGGNNEEDNTEG